jgi:hypothetical protein
VNRNGFSNFIHYKREGFVKLLRLLRERMQISEENWFTIMERFLSLQAKDKTMVMDTVYSNDLWAQLHYQGVYTVPHMKQGSYSHVGRFKKWKDIPPIVRVILLILRESVFTLKDEVENIGNTVLHCNVRGKRMHNIFTSIHASFGTVISSGDHIAIPRSDMLLIHEDGRE